MWKLLRRFFASAVADNATTKMPFLRTPLYMNVVERQLDRKFGLSIERRNQHIPILAPDQVDRDLTSMQNMHQRNRRIETNTSALQ